jgi:thiamine pyrophosphate-dependent acetolactate synthase large subunit-like protein
LSGLRRHLNRQLKITNDLDERKRSSYIGKEMPLPDSETRNIMLIADIVNTHEKVMLFCRHGCRYALDDLMQLAQTLNSPLGYSFRGEIFFERK